MSQPNVIPKNSVRKGEIPGPGQELYRLIRGGFIQSGSTLTEWCRENGLKEAWVRSAIFGMTDTPGAQEVRQRAAEAAGLGNGVNP